MPWTLPGKRLVFERARLAAPGVDPVKMQSHLRVRIGEDPRDPRVSALDLDAELFADFALERLGDRLPGLDFAAGKLPVARVHLVAGALRKERGAVGTDQHRRGDIHRGR